MIKIGSRHFCTEGLPLSDRRANFFAGQGTRVFAVVETDMQWSDITIGEPRIALKIYWPRVNAVREGEIIERIRKIAKKNGDDSWLPIVLIASEAQVLVEDENGVRKYCDDTTKNIVDVDLSTASKKFYPGATAINTLRSGTNTIKGSARLQSVGGVRAELRTESVTGLSGTNYVNPSVEDFIRIWWVDRVQYRIAFDGIGKTVAELGSIYEIFMACRDGLRGELMAFRIYHIC